MTTTRSSTPRVSDTELGRSFDALGDATRRRILEVLRGGPLAVGRLADRLPVSRPAVSQHLRVLEAAGLVRHRVEGKKHLYQLEAEGLACVRQWIDEFWSEVLAAFVARADER